MSRSMKKTPIIGTTNVKASSVKKDKKIATHILRAKEKERLIKIVKGEAPVVFPNKKIVQDVAESSRRGKKWAGKIEGLDFRDLVK